ncbi:MAG: DUF349 domain-containing protein [Rikenellaceae bacterium]|nr:DUF349 domain-containing protein [Rikenellaceae bacterium]MCL2692445.1 DUF349 domain-containing protein [Rikenellaceae bacterium]
MMTENTNTPVPEEQIAVPETCDANERTAPEETTEPTAEEAIETTPEPVTELALETATEEATPDFSDEEAELAAAAPEFDLGEENEQEKEQAADTDLAGKLAGKTKAELLEMFAELLGTKPVQSIRREAEAIKTAFYKAHRVHTEELKAQFIAGGGAEEEFVAPSDADEQRLKDLFAEYRKRRSEHIATLERSKEDNLKIKLQIIEELKELVSGNETLNQTFNSFRELQQRWREIGPVPQANVKDLWETYNLHVENFYSYIKINKELRDLDLRRNYEAKIALAEEAEALILETSVVEAFHKLQKLHEQWREVGPVANEHKETLWDRFREASGRVNKAHQDHFDRLKDEQKANLDLKGQLCTKVEQLADAAYSSRKGWSKASDELLEIQKVWKTIGFAPKKDNAKVYERFRTACDKFFEQKRSFYVEARGEMDHNLRLKTQLCEAVEALQDSEDWRKTTDDIIALQREWKVVGPVARRHSDTIWKRFRSACDKFFERKSTHFSGREDEQDQNLIRKRELLSELEQADVALGGFEMIKDFQRRWSEIGFVPIKKKEAVQKEYKALMDKMFDALRGSDHTRSMDRFKNKVSEMRTAGGDRRLRGEREKLIARVKQLEADIALLENNIGFFAHSKNAESMIRDVREKIDRARQERDEALQKVRVLESSEE